MLLPDYFLPEEANVVRDEFPSEKNTWNYSFNPQKILYVNNSRGFRDSEWPETIEELRSAIWCIGDSATYGVGLPLESTWPKILEEKTGIRTINLSMIAASNQWISRKSKGLIEHINPKNIIIMWSFMHRREDPDVTLSDLQRRMHYQYLDRRSCLEEDIQTFEECITGLTLDHIVHLGVPGFDPDKIINKFKIPNFLGQVKQMDYGRDIYHYGPDTNRFLVDMIIPHLSLDK